MSADPPPAGVVSVAYLGPPGTNSEVAAVRVFPAARHVPYSSVADAVHALERGEVSRAVAAIENSLQGSVTETVDLLIRDDGIAICGELVLDIEHCLMVRPGASHAGIAVIYSHPQSLGQCRDYLERAYPGVPTVAALSNAAAVAEMLRVPGSAAIAPARAAEIYGAEIVGCGIQDSRVNRTRFVVLGRAGAPATGHDKTSIAFAVAHDRPGTLVSVLHEFSDRSINLTKIESRPSREELGIYVFLLDIEGHRDDPLVAQALAAVKEQADFFRVFGSYPAWQPEPSAQP
ncbi:MAG: prephenate dehydratase [Dehalococcoidia bacterium]|nr:prephenate dehydratase [Dehalococcoidia bacterium]